MMVKKFILSFILILTALLILSGDCSASNQKMVAELQETINTLLQQLAQLRQKLQEILVAKGVFEPVQPFSNDLWFGVMRNPEVKRLQEFLILQSYLDFGLNTGNYLSKTLQAVKNFQKDWGLPATGYFGPMTREVVNEYQQPLSSLVENKTEKPEPETMNQVPAVTQIIQVLEEPGYRLQPKPIYDTWQIENLIYDFVNQERVARGLSALSVDDSLVEIARSHSADQAQDNFFLTNPNVLCQYPFIRHEGFLSGFLLKDRLENQGISFRLAGENIAIHPLTTNLIYQRLEHESPIECSEAQDDPAVPGETEKQAIARIKQNIEKRKELVESQERVVWVNKEWLTPEEVSSKVVKDWMHSKHHKEIILRPEFNKTGVGVVIVNEYLLVTQVFLKP